MKKRIIAFLLMIMMIVSVVGCSDDSASSQNGDSSKQEEISINTDEYLNEDGTIKMPDLTNMPVEDAKKVLKDLGLKPKVTEDYDTSGNIEVGCVIKTDYLPGESVKKGKQVILTVRKEGQRIDPDVPYVDPLVAERGELEQGANNDYKPLNYETMKAIWISQFDLQGVLAETTQNSEESLRKAFGAVCDQLVKDGYNTVIVQVRPYGDSFYPSAYYPWSSYALGS